MGFFAFLSRLFGSNSPKAANQSIEEEILNVMMAEAEYGVIAFLRDHPEQIPPGINLPPKSDGYFSYTSKKTPRHASEDDIRFDLGDDDPPPGLTVELYQKAGPPLEAGATIPRHRLPGSPLATSFASDLMEYVRIRFAGQAPLVYRNAGLSRQTYSAIISDDQHQVARPTALALACALHLSETEANDFLKKAGYALSDSLLADVIIRCCLRCHVWHLDIINKLLDKYHCATIP